MCTMEVLLASNMSILSVTGLPSNGVPVAEPEVADGAIG